MTIIPLSGRVDPESRTSDSVRRPITFTFAVLSTRFIYSSRSVFQQPVQWRFNFPREPPLQGSWLQGFSNPFKNGEAEHSQFMISLANTVVQSVLPFKAGAFGPHTTSLTVIQSACTSRNLQRPYGATLQMIRGTWSVQVIQTFCISQRRGNSRVLCIDHKAGY